MYRYLPRLLPIFLSIIIAITSSAVTPQQAVDEFVRSSGVDSTKIGILITDLRSGQRIAEYGASRSLVPASVMKASTTGALLAIAGPSQRYHTKVYTRGRTINSILDGDLLVVASGDPTLNHNPDFEGTDFIKEIVDALENEGIDKIRGKIVIDNSVFEGPDIPSSWQRGDLAHYYGAPCRALNFEGNRTGRRAVTDPEALFRSRLHTALTKAGIEIEEKGLPGGALHLLVDHASAAYEDIMRSCMMRSDNLYAEAMLRTLARRLNAPGSTEAGAREAAKVWKKRDIPLSGVCIVDGSGLSRSNRLTAAFLTGILTDIADNVEYASFFPLAGQEGTLKKFLADTPLDSYVALKTGSMNGIQSYAGYLLDEDFAPTHSIVVISNNLKDRNKMRSDLEKCLLEIFVSQNPN